MGLVSKLINPFKVKVYPSAIQENIPHNTWTTINLDAISYDIGSNFDTANKRFVAPVEGYYLVIGKVTYLAGSVIADKMWGIALWNGTVYKGNLYVHSSNTSSLGILFTNIIHLTVGEYLYMRTYHYAGVNTPDVNKGPDDTFLSIHLISI